MRSAEFGMRRAAFGMRKRPHVVSWLVIIGLGIATVSAAERTWTRSEILAIADAKAKEVFGNVEQMSVSVDRQNTEWRQRLLEQHDKEILQHITTPLAKREYWALHYTPLTGSEYDFSVWIFVDRFTGEVITTIVQKGWFLGWVPSGVSP